MKYNLSSSKKKVKVSIINIIFLEKSGKKGVRNTEKNY